MSNNPLWRGAQQKNHYILVYRETYTLGGRGTKTKQPPHICNSKIIEADTITLASPQTLDKTFHKAPNLALLLRIG